MRDEWFIRGNVPMTKSEARAVSLSKLELYPGCVLWDIGAGTGSVSVEAALFCPGIRIAAIEFRPEAADLIRKNCEKAGISSIAVVEEKAPECFGGLCTEGAPGREGERPTHAFIGGTSGRMGEILDALHEINPGIRVVINMIALESLSQVLEYINKRGIPAEVVSVQIARAEAAAGLHLMKGQNPVYVASFGGDERQDRDG